MWPETVLEQFQLVDRFTTDESEFYGPYNTLLTECFPHGEHYQISPQFNGPITLGSIELTVIYIVRKRKYPVFFIEIKPHTHIRDMGTRAKADDQMRERFTYHIGTALTVPVLYGVSALGTTFSVYQYEKETTRLTPSRVIPSAEYVTDVAPAARWSFDLMEDQGETKFRELVKAVKDMCAQL